MIYDISEAILYLSVVEKINAHLINKKHVPNAHHLLLLQDNLQDDGDFATFTSVGNICCVEECLCDGEMH